MTEPSEKKQLFSAVAVIVSATMSISGVAVFFLFRSISANGDIAIVNRDGISCVIEQLNRHHQAGVPTARPVTQPRPTKTATPKPKPKPTSTALPHDLFKACDRFFQNR